MRTQPTGATGAPVNQKQIGAGKRKGDHMELSTKNMAAAIVGMSVIQEAVCGALEMEEPEFLGLVDLLEDKELERLGARCERLMLAEEYFTLTEGQAKAKANVKKLEKEAENLLSQVIFLEGYVALPLEENTPEEIMEAKEDLEAMKEAHEETLAALERMKLKLGAITYKIMTFQGKGGAIWTN